MIRWEPARTRRPAALARAAPADPGVPASWRQEPVVEPGELGEAS